MKNPHDLFKLLWDEYRSKNPQVIKIHDSLKSKGEEVINDHMALRTFNDPRINVDVVAKAYTNLGYKEVGQYHFKEKKLYAKHFEHPDSKLPKVFISELILEEFSLELQTIVKELVDQVDPKKTNQPDFSCSQIHWKPISYATYSSLKKETEYAAWLATNGFCTNHFTVSINHLQSMDSLNQINQHIKSLGLKINSSGGEIKGSPEEYLEQSSTLADQREYQFSDQSKTIPCCYYEFAKRYPLPNGKLFQGFIAKSANKIFESTDTKSS